MKEFLRGLDRICGDSTKYLSKTPGRISERHTVTSSNLMLTLQLP
jgi:hypothetical protein